MLLLVLLYEADYPAILLLVLLYEADCPLGAIQVLSSCFFLCLLIAYSWRLRGVRNKFGLGLPRPWWSGRRPVRETHQGGWGWIVCLPRRPSAIAIRLASHPTHPEGCLGSGAPTITITPRLRHTIHRTGDKLSPSVRI